MTSETSPRSEAARFDRISWSPKLKTLPTCTMRDWSTPPTPTYLTISLSISRTTAGCTMKPSSSGGAASSTKNFEACGCTAGSGSNRNGTRTPASSLTFVR